MPKKNPYLKVKVIEASSRALIGRSQMTKEIEKWTNKGWVLAKQQKIGKTAKHRLTFEYQMSDEEIAAEKSQQRKGRIGCGVIILILILLSSLDSSQRAAERAVTQTAAAIKAVTQVAMANATNTQQHFNETATATLWTPTNTPTPSNTPTSTNTATATYTPSSTFTPSKTPTPSDTPTATNTATITLTPTFTSTPTITHTPTNTATITDTVEPSPTNAPAVTWYVTNNANGRACERTDCAVVARLSRGSSVSVVGSVEGESVSGSAIWKEAIYDGQRVYIHSSLLSQNAPPTAAPVVVQQAPAEQRVSTIPPPPVSQPVQQPAGFVPVCSGNVYNCADLTCEQMAIYWNTCPGDPSGLDGNDNDGRYCESKCG